MRVGCAHRLAPILEDLDQADSFAASFVETTALKLDQWHVESDRYVQHNSFVEFDILPNAIVGADAFYDADGALLPKYAAYMDRLRDMSTYHERNRELNHRLADELRRSLRD